MLNSTTMKSTADDGAASVADAAKIIADIERQLTVARGSLDGLTRARRHSAYLAALGDRGAKSHLAVLASDEAQARQWISDLGLALGVARERLDAAQAAEIAARRPRYVSDQTRRIGGREIAADTEYELLTWPTENDAPANEAAEQVTAYFEINKEHPQLPDAPWHALTNTLFLPFLSPHTPPPVRRWVDPRKPWNSAAAGLNSISTVALPRPDAPPRRPAGSQRRGV